MSPGRIMVFLKAPRPGWVKTRIAASLDDDAAAAICRVLMDRTVAALAGFDRVQLRVDPDDAVKDVGRWCRVGWEVCPQGPGDFGARLARGFREAFEAGSAWVLAVGADCPGLEGEDLNQAMSALDHEDLVLGPAEDGGCWLIGMRASHPSVFEGVPWNSSQAFEVGCGRAQALGWKVRTLRRLAAVDTLADWRQWLRTQPI